MRKFRCRYCSHVYDESLGDPATGIAPGTRFENLPEDWICPECGAAKSDYDLIE
jgi:rubredoxin-NAD+ reductase